MMQWYDWLIVAVPVLFVLGMGLYTRRYLKDVTTYLSAGRVCGRYVIAVASLESALGLITMAAYVEANYKAGFAYGFWRGMVTPLALMLSLYYPALLGLALIISILLPGFRRED